MTFDVIVIGAGPGGYVAAIRAAELGMSVAIVDKRETLGGTCLNVGCIPSKALLYSSKMYATVAKDGKNLGIECTGLSPNLAQMMHRKEGIVKGLTQGVSTLMKMHKITPFFGEAKFLSPHEIEVSFEKGVQVLQGKNFILATGSESIELPFLPFDEKRILSSTGALTLTQIPKKMIVVGGGVIGVELASLYNRLGSEVTIVEMLDRICPAMDGAVSKMLQQLLKKQGIAFHLSAEVQKAKVDPENGHVALFIREDNKAHVLNGDAVLVAVGRRPYSEGLKLKEIGVTLNPKGYVLVNDFFRTTHPHIYAIGDLIEGVMLAHRASDEGVAVSEIIGGLTPRINYLAIPNVIYTEPEVASIGLTEKEARDLNLNIAVGIASLKANPRGRCTGEEEGMVKVIADRRTGRLIGMHIVSSNASEMIGEGVIAMEKKATVQEIAKASHAHPTFAESIKEACASCK